MKLTELEEELGKLDAADFNAFRRWLDSYSAKRWDEQFEQDVLAGKLDRLGKKADAAFESGRCKEL